MANTSQHAACPVCGKVVQLTRVRGQFTKHSGRKSETPCLGTGTLPLRRSLASRLLWATNPVLRGMNWLCLVCVPGLLTYVGFLTHEPPLTGISTAPPVTATVSRSVEAAALDAVPECQQRPAKCAITAREVWHSGRGDLEAIAVSVVTRAGQKDPQLLLLDPERTVVWRTSGFPSLEIRELDTDVLGRGLLQLQLTSVVTDHAAVIAA